VIGALDVGHVATLRDEGERAFPEARDRLSCLGLRKHPVAFPPHHERRDLQGREKVHHHLALTEGTH
jgi:hypothetical protein